MRTFATPIQKRVPEKEISKLIFGVSLKAQAGRGTQKETERTTSSLKRLETVQASTEKKYNLSRSVNSFERNYEVSETSLEIYIIIYNEEFDPGSG